jgi:GntR family transcriptional regulator
LTCVSLYDTLRLVISINLEDARPLEEQVIAALRLAIVRGEIHTGDALPSARQLGGDLGIHWNTVARAYRRLNHEGLIAVRHGRKAVVTGRVNGSADAARASLRTDLVEALTLGRSKGLSRRDLTEVFRDALAHLQERKT